MLKKTLVAAAILSLTSLGFAVAPAHFAQTNALTIQNLSAQSVNVSGSTGSVGSVGIGQTSAFPLKKGDHFTTIHDQNESPLMTFDYTSNQIQASHPALIHQSSGAYQLLGCGTGPFPSKDGSISGGEGAGNANTSMISQEAYVILFTKCDDAESYARTHNL